MKQHITKEQWDELHKTQKLYYLNMIHKMPRLMCVEEVDLQDWWKIVSIGQMIEFLGGDLTYIRNNVHTQEVHLVDGKLFKAGELADALWEAVKDKLK